MKISSLLVFLFLFINANSFALDKNKIDDLDKWAEKSATLDWKNFHEESEYITKIEDINASIKIEKEDFYLNNIDDINQYSYWTWGIPDDSNMLLRSDKGYNLFISSNKDGYVKIDDWKNVDTDAWIKELNENAKKIAIERKRKNIDYALNFKWIKKPELDRKKNMVFYAYEVSWNDGSNSLESISLVLGKDGYATLVFTTVDMETPFSQLTKTYKSKAETFKFNEGSTYSEYKTGDKIAAVGIGALLATTLGIKALNPGLLATLGKLFAKFWFIILLPFIFIGKLMSGLTKRKKRK